MLKMSINEFAHNCNVPMEVIAWLKKMQDGETLIFGKFVLNSASKENRAQALIRKANGYWRFDGQWRFKNVYPIPRIYTHGRFRFEGDYVCFEDYILQDLDMFFSVIKRLEIHLSTLSDEHKKLYSDKGFRPLYAFTWIGADGLSKSILYKKGEMKEPSIIRFPPDFIDTITMDDYADFDYFPRNSNLIDPPSFETNTLH